MIIGCGGAGKAVSAFFSKEIEKGDLYLTSKNKKNKAYSEKLENTTWVDWDKKQEFLNNLDIIINCSSLGFDTQIHISPIQEEFYKNLKSSVIRQLKY